jgi:hypothetical protein
MARNFRYGDEGTSETVAILDYAARVLFFWISLRVACPCCLKVDHVDIGPENEGDLEKPGWPTPP